MILSVVGPFSFKEVVFYLKIYILNPNQFKSTDQVAVSASIPPPLPFFFQMFGPFGPKHIN